MNLSKEPNLSPSEQALYDRRDDEHGPVIERQVCMTHGVIFERRQKIDAETTWNEMVLGHDDCHAVVAREIVHA